MEAGGSRPAGDQSPRCAPGQERAHHGHPAAVPPAGDSARGPQQRHEHGDTEGGGSGRGAPRPCALGGREREPLPVRLAEGQLPVPRLLPQLGQGAQAALRGPRC